MKAIVTYSEIWMPFLETFRLTRYLPSTSLNSWMVLTEGNARSTARLRYAQLKAFFNFTVETMHLSMLNPCNDPLLSKTFRAPRMKQREIIGREVIDEIIY